MDVYNDTEKQYRIQRSTVGFTSMDVKQYCDKLMVIKETVSGCTQDGFIRSILLYICGYGIGIVFMAASMIYCMSMYRQEHRVIAGIMLSAVFLAYYLSKLTSEIRRKVEQKAFCDNLADLLEEKGLSGTLEMELIIGAYALFETKAKSASVSEITGLFRLFNDEAGLWLTDQKDIAVLVDDRYQINKKLIRGKVIDLSGLQRDLEKVKYVMDNI